MGVGCGGEECVVFDKFGVKFGEWEIDEWFFCLIIIYRD